MLRKIPLPAAVAACAFFPQTAAGAGWDTPSVHTARAQGMGGTAIGGVNDPSATFHNPAGLGSIEGLEVLGSFSYLFGKVSGSPDPAALSHDSSELSAPFPLLGAGWTLTDYLSLGVGGFPVTSGSSSYAYDSAGESWEDSLSVLFFEVTPQVALTLPEDVLPGRLSFGVGYRLTFTNFDRKKGIDGELQLLDVSTSGLDATGFRFGLQYSPIPELRLGVVLRNKVVVDTTASSGVALGNEMEDLSVDFTLPLKVGLGARFDIDRFGLALDYEYADQSQNNVSYLRGSIEGDEVEVPHIFNWQDGHTFRSGFEYRVPAQRNELPLRLGYVFDSAVTTKAYPSAFGAPPASTHSITAGIGFRTRDWEVNAAWAYRFGSTTVTADDLGEGCEFCGQAGDYGISVTSLSIDASYNFDL